MAFANPSVSDIIATTIEKRSRKVADNVSKNNGLLTYLEQRGRSRPITGGSVIFEEISFAENTNAGFYSGYDLLPVNPSDVLSAASFDIKQAACPVIMSGLEGLQNAGPEAFIDLMSERLSVAEDTMMNLISLGLYSDGTGYGGKEIIGLDAAVPATLPASQSSTYGGISRSTWSFWRTKYATGTYTTMLADMNAMYASLTRGLDAPDVILMDNLAWAKYVGVLQAQQRFADLEGNARAGMGFKVVKFMGTDVVLDGGIGGFGTANTAYFLNLKYLSWRPHRQRNFVPINPNERVSINQDAHVQIMGWAGALTSRGSQFQGRILFS